MRGSIRLRLSGFYGGLLAVALVLFCAVVYVVFRGRLYDHADSQLRADATGAMNLFLEEFYEVEDDDEDDDLEVGPYGFEDVDLPATEVHFQLVGSDGATLQVTAGLEKTPLFAVGAEMPMAPELRTVEHAELGRVRRYILPARAASETYYVCAAKALAPVDAALRQLLILFAVFLPGTLLLVGLGGYWLAGRALEPVDQVIEAARAIREGDLNRRIALDGPTDELKALADEFDAMIASLEALVASERRFVADASHELRTPLAVIEACVQVHLREQNAPPEELREALTVVRGETQTMTRLVEDLLTLARADAGEEQLRLDDVPLAALLEDARDTVHWVTNGRTLEIDVAEGITVRGDVMRLGQLLRALLDNALKHSPPTGTVTVATRREGEWVRIEVADEGAGIAAEHLPRIFDRFYRVDMGRSRDVGGSGLGLAICRWIAEAHGGRIEVKSTVGAGTVFAVVLPAAR